MLVPLRSKVRSGERTLAHVSDAFPVALPRLAGDHALSLLHVSARAKREEPPFARNPLELVGAAFDEFDA